MFILDVLRGLGGDYMSLERIWVGDRDWSGRCVDEEFI